METSDLIKELEELRSSEKHYRTLLNDTSDPIFSFFPDGRYRYGNAAFVEGVGETVESIITKSIWDVFSPEEAEKRFAVVKRVFESKEPAEIEVRVDLPTGTSYYLTTAKPILNEDGEVETVICASKNITSRKLAEIALEEERDKLKKALEEIHTLTGLLPICSSCHSIRDEKDHWGRFEEYVQKHSEAKFSHTLCPNCAKKLYPDLDIK